MKKKFTLCGILTCFPLLTACPDLDSFIKSEEKEETIDVVQDEKVVETKEETKTEEKEQPKEENNTQEKTNEEEKVPEKEAAPEIEPEIKPEPEWQPDYVAVFNYPLMEDPLDKNEKPTSPEPLELSSDEGYTEVSYATFHEITSYVCNSYTYGIKYEEKDSIYSFATITINGNVMLEEGLTSLSLSANQCWYKKAGDVYGIVGSNYEPSFPDVARLTVLTGVKGNEERIRVWDEEVKRADKANNTLTANKFAYYLINTRAKNIENKQNSPYLVTFTGDSSQKTFKYYVSNSKDGYKFSFTCSRGTTEYIFNEIGRVVKVISSSSQYENFECNIIYRDVATVSEN